MANAHLHYRSSRADLERARFGWLARIILLAQAFVLLFPLLISPAAAACSTSGTTITCASGSNTNNVSNSVNDVTANVQSGAVLSVPPLLGGSSLTLNGNGTTLNNQGSIDPTINGGLSLAASGAVIGNSAANTININNETGGVINGLVNTSSLYGFGGQALVVQNGSGAVTTIQNAGSIGMSIFGAGANTTADAPAIVAYGGGQVKFTNTGTITGRIGFEAPGAAGVGNTFLNAGTINGSVYLGNSAAGNTFTAVSGSSVNNAGVATAGTMTIGAATVNFAAAGIVDGGTGTNNTLVLQNSATGPGSGTGGTVTTINASNYLDFQKLVVNSGTWNLQGNVVSGSAALNDGLVNFNSSGAFGSGAIQVSGGAIAASTAGLSLANAVSLNPGNGLTLQGNNSLTLTGIISGIGGLIINTNAATVTLTGANVFTGGLTVNAGTLALGSGGSLAASGAVNLAGAGAGFNISAAGNQTIGSLSGVAGSTVALGGNILTLGGVGNSSFSGSITGGGSLIKDGAGTQTLNGASNFSGGVTLNAGGLLLGNNSALGTGALTVGGATTLDGTTAVTLANNINLNAGLTVLGGQAVTLGGQILGAGSLTKNGAATLTLTGADLFTGGLFINAGTVALGAGGSLSANGIVNLAAGAGLDISAGGNQSMVLIGAGTVALGANTLTLGDGGFGGSIGGTGGLVKVGSGTLTLTGTSGFTGGLVIDAGTVALGAGGSLAATGAVSLAGAGAGFDISAGGNQTIGSLSGVGGTTVALGANTLTLGGIGNSSFSGSIGGTGGLVKDGSGTQTLSGASNYSGGTTVNGGLINFNAAANFGSNNITLNGGGLQWAAGTTTDISGQLNAIGTNGTTFDYNGNAVTLATALAGSGGVTIANSGSGGSLIMTAVENYTGITTIQSGSYLSLVGAGSVASSSKVINNGTLDLSVTTNGASITSLSGTSASANLFLDGGKTLTITAANDSYAGNISGPGGALVLLSGIQMLTGTISYTGRTTVNGGTLEIGSGGSITQSASLTNSANFTVDTGGSATFGSVTNNAGGTITNNGTVTDDLNNAGTVTNNSTYVANVASNTGTITNNSIWTGTIITSGTFTNAAGATVSGLVTNSGTGSNVGTLSGGLTNTAGTFNNTGTIGGTTTVSGGTLFGTGSTGTLNVANGGAFAPGNGTPGTFATVNGSLALTSGAFYVVGLNPTTASFANVSGTATLGGGSVLALFSSGSYVVKQYTILNATGGVSGTFNTLANTNLPAGFASTLSYDATHAYLNLALNLTPVSPSGGGSSAPVNGGSNGNQRNVAANVVNFFNANGFIPIAFGMLTPTGLTQASGELATGSQQTTFNAMTQFMGVMTDPFVAGRGDDLSAGGGGATGYSDEASAYAARHKPNDALAAIYTKAPAAVPFEPRWSTWAAGFGGSQNTDGNAVAGSNNTTSSVYGTAVGADYRVSPFTIAGFALAGGGTAFSVNGSGSGHSDLFQAGAFIRHDVGPLYISAALAYGWQDITTNRTVTIAGADQLHAEFNANAFSGRVESGYRFVTPFAGGVGITPYAAGQFTTFDLPSYAEAALSGASTFALAYNARSVTDTRSELGIRTDKSFVVQGGIFTLRSRVAWAHDYDPDRSIAATFQSLPGASFVVNGAAQAADSALTTASAEMKWSSGWSVSGTFEGEFSSVTNSYAGKGVVRYAW